MFTFFFNHFGAMHLKAAKFGEKTQNMGYFAEPKVIQGHRFWNQLKAHIRLLLVINTNLLATVSEIQHSKCQKSLYCVPFHTAGEAKSAVYDCLVPYGNTSMETSLRV